MTTAPLVSTLSVAGPHSQSNPTIPKPHGSKATKPPVGAKKKKLTPISHIIDLTIEELQSHTTLPIIEEILPSNSVSSPSWCNPSPHTTSTFATISDTIPYGTLLGMDMYMDVYYVVQSITEVSSGEAIIASMMSLLLESGPLLSMRPIIT